MENADAPIRYRVARELYNDGDAAKRIEPEFYKNPEVVKWLKLLKPDTPPQHRSMEHGSFNFCLENSLLKTTQLGLHAGMPAVRNAVRYYISKAGHLPGKPYRGRANDGVFIFGCNLLACAGFTDGAVIGFLRESLEEMYGFVQKGSYDIYCGETERAALKNLPAVYRERKIIKSSVVDAHGFCFPLIYDVVGLSGLYAHGDAETDKKIDAVIRYISTDEFHETVADGYGVLPPYHGRYHTMGWDPKYPGWSGVAGHIERCGAGRDASKLLFFAQYVVKYPRARQTKWFGELSDCLEKYRTDGGTYIFPAKWLDESRGYAVQGHHLSFGENRRKRNWAEIESTFYMQTLRKYIM